MARRKRGFTLIELLVVIAIIAVLAAILFPVFAQARVSAKRADLTTRLRQTSLAIQMYGTDFDDQLPRGDGCQLNSALNPALRSPAFNLSLNQGCANGSPGYNRVDLARWQKWVNSYVRNEELFFNPGLGRRVVPFTNCPNGLWESCGIISRSYALALHMTGISSRVPNQSFSGAFGGTLSGMPNPSANLLLLELNHGALPYLPGGLDPLSLQSRRLVPPAWREAFETHYLAPAPPGVVRRPNPQVVVSGQVAVGYADGSVRSMPVERMISMTPRVSEYAPGSFGQGLFFEETMVFDAPVNLNLDYPLWGLERN